MWALWEFGASCATDQFKLNNLLRLLVLIGLLLLFLIVIYKNK